MLCGSTAGSNMKLMSGWLKKCPIKTASCRPMYHEIAMYQSYDAQSSWLLWNKVCDTMLMIYSMSSETDCGGFFSLH